MPDERVLLVGFDGAEAEELVARIPFECIVHGSLPRIVVEDGVLCSQSAFGSRYLNATRVVFHGIFEHDLAFLAGLALWGGPCFPNPLAMMDCRQRLPCLVRALRHTRFGGGQRGFASAGGVYNASQEHVAKWGDWHCGENKQRFTGDWTAEAPTLFEPFQHGEAVRVVVLRAPRQIRLAGESWLKSVHGKGAEFMPADPQLVEDTLAIQRGLGLDILAKDYIVTPEGPFLLEVNHIPSVTCFPELWREYVDLAAEWVRGSPSLRDQQRQ